MPFPKISIVTPSYNQGEYIEQTILSVLDQQYPNLEYIIIDGGSSDNTVEIIRKYESRISYWVSEKDDGQTDAINKGFEKCTGDIFNWINSDDYYEPGSLHKLAKIFISNPDVNVVCGKEWGFNNDKPYDRILHIGSILTPDVFETIRIGIIDQPCTFFKKKCINHIFPLNKRLKYTMDKQMWWTYLLQYGQKNIQQVDDVFTHFRIHSQSKSVAEQHLFEAETDILRLSLFTQLGASPLLKKQLSVISSPTEVNWQVNLSPSCNILSAFASAYARRSYVAEDMDTCRVLMHQVKTWKGWRMNGGEWKLWLLSCVMPKAMLFGLKKIKQFTL